MTTFSLPATLDDVRALLRDLPAADSDAMAKADARESQLTKPAGSLGRLEGLSRWLAGWQGRHPARVDTVQILIYAGNHGVAAQGVSAFPAEVTVQMVANFAHGGAAINQLSKAAGAELQVIDLDLDKPTADFTVAPAMTEDECLAAFTIGMRSVADDTDLVCVGEMGIANTTVAAALCRALLGGTAVDWVGPGTGVDKTGMLRKQSVVETGYHTHQAHLTDGLAALQRLGGRELAAMAGAVLAARLKRIPVLLDGYVSTAAAATLWACDRHALDHCQAGHRSAEPAHIRLLEHLGLDPLLDLGMRLGEGSGAALAVSIVKAAAATHAGMATFAEAGVSNKDEA